MLDILIVTFSILAFIRGYRKGLIITLFSMAAVVLGILLALKLSGVLASYLFSAGWVGSGWASVLSYVLIFVGVAYVIKLGGRMIEKSITAVSLGWLNRLAGGALLAFTAVFVWSGMLWLANAVGALGDQSKADSKTYAWVAPIAPAVLEKVGDVLPFVQNVFSEVTSLSDQLSNTLKPSVDTPR